MVRFILNYVNLSDGEVYPEKDFYSIDDLITFVQSEYALYTSYNITVLPPLREPA